MKFNPELVYRGLPQVSSGHHKVLSVFFIVLLPVVKEEFPGLGPGRQNFSSGTVLHPDFKHTQIELYFPTGRG